MRKEFYQIIDSRGRVYLPKQLKDVLKLNHGDIIKWILKDQQLQLQKVLLIEVGDQSEDAMEAYVSAVLPTLSRDRQLALAAQLLKQINREDKKQ